MIVYFPTGFNEAGVQTITLGYAQAWFSGDSQQGATLIGRWFDPIIVRADTGPITARAETKVGL